MKTAILICGSGFDNSAQLAALESRLKSTGVDIVILKQEVDIQGLEVPHAYIDEYSVVTEKEIFKAPPVLPLMKHSKNEPNRGIPVPKKYKRNRFDR